MVAKVYFQHRVRDLKKTFKKTLALQQADVEDKERP